jgi:hypothetical protein
MSHKRCFVYLCSAFPIIGILGLTSVVLYICVIGYYWYFMSQALFCISVLWIPHNWYFMFHKRCFVYLCYDFPIIDILCFTSVVLYICVMIFPYLIFYVSQALFCISLLWFPYNWYFMFHKRCFVYLCYDFPIIDILCFTLLFCVSVLCSPYNWYFMYQKRCFVFVFCFPYYWYLMSHKRCFVYLCYDFLLICILSFTKSCFVYLCYDFPIICILCLTSVVLYICVLLSLLLVFYVSQRVVLYICVMISL